MATTRPFSRNTGLPIYGTTQYGNIVTGDISVDYSDNYGGIKWWMGPDEDLGYVIAHEDSGGGHNGKPGNVSAYVGTSFKLIISPGQTGQKVPSVCPPVLTM